MNKKRARRVTCDTKQTRQGGGSDARQSIPPQNCWEGKKRVPPLRVDLGTATDVGLVRERNEDACLARPLEPGSALPGIVLAVADGMGGHRAGEVASALSLQALLEALRPALAAPGAGRAAILERAVAAANRQVWALANATPDLEGMGTTLVCAVVDSDGEATIANVGDSRAYLVAGASARLLTVDHSLVGELLRAGRISAQEAHTHPYRQVLSRALGVQPDVAVDTFGGVLLSPGDSLVLCSDGLSAYLEPAELASLVRASLGAQDTADRLVALALRRGGHDNATVVVARALG